MKRWSLALLVLVPALALAGPADTGKVKVKLDTSMGVIVLELDQAKAPKTVASFLEYVRSGHYTMTTFHRVIPGFMIQGGGFTPEMEQKPTRPPIPNEAGNGLKNLRGTISMARTGVVDSATSQFFINLVDNAFLNHSNETPQGFGYCVFGKVVDGMQVVDAIAKVQTGSVGGFENVPTQPVLIKKASIQAASALAKPPEPPKSDQPKTK